MSIHIAQKKGTYMSIFFQTKKHRRWQIGGMVLLFFLAIVGTLAFVLLHMVSSYLSDENTNEVFVAEPARSQIDDVGTADTVVVSTIDDRADLIALQSQYMQDIDEVMKYVEGGSLSIPRMLTYVEDALLSMHVPGSYTDAHLHAVLSIATLRAQVDMYVADDIVSRVRTILLSLQKK